MGMPLGLRANMRQELQARIKQLQLFKKSLQEHMVILPNHLSYTWQLYFPYANGKLTG